MGTDLNDTTIDTNLTSTAARPTVRAIPWLDAETAAAVIDITQSVAENHPEVQAVILFGSVARREERPLDDPQPSDVDLLLVLDATVRDPALLASHASTIWRSSTPSARPTTVTARRRVRCRGSSSTWTWRTGIQCSSRTSLGTASCSGRVLHCLRHLRQSPSALCMNSSSHKPQNDRIVPPSASLLGTSSRGVRSHRASRPPYRPTPPRQGQCPAGAAPSVPLPSTPVAAALTWTPASGRYAGVEPGGVDRTSREACTRHRKCKWTTGLDLAAPRA